MILRESGIYRGRTWLGNSLLGPSRRALGIQPQIECLICLKACLILYPADQSQFSSTGISCGKKRVEMECLSRKLPSPPPPSFSHLPDLGKWLFLLETEPFFNFGHIRNLATTTRFPINVLIRYRVSGEMFR